MDSIGTASSPNPEGSKQNSCFLFPFPKLDKGSYYRIRPRDSQDFCELKAFLSRSVNHCCVTSYILNLEFHNFLRGRYEKHLFKTGRRQAGFRH